jgi:prolyl 4-hydroxylase
VNWQLLCATGRCCSPRGISQPAAAAAAAAEVEEGGETTFPNGHWLDEAAQAEPPYSECGAKGVGVKPRKGDALLFFSLHPNGGWVQWVGGWACGCCCCSSSCCCLPLPAGWPGGLTSSALPLACPSLRAGQKKDHYSLHAGCPVVRGEKYSATSWIHVEPFGHTTVQQPTTCADAEPACAQWAASGECERNSAYMKGSDSAVGHCRLSCKVCRACQPGDVLCERANAGTA